MPVAIPTERVEAFNTAGLWASIFWTLEHIDFSDSLEVIHVASEAELFVF